VRSLEFWRYDQTPHFGVGKALCGNKNRALCKNP
jgi:hypothetical protein